MKLTLAVSILILFVNYHQALCKAIEILQTEAKEKKLAEVQAKRQSFASEDDYYNEGENEEEEDEDALQQSLKDENYEETAGGHGEGGAEPEDEYDNEDDEGDEEDEEGYEKRFMENTVFLNNIFDIIQG